MSNQKRYALNLERFFELITKKTNNEKNADFTVTEIWQPDTDNDLRIVNKEIVDNRYDKDPNMCNARYDFLNNLINQVLSVYQTPDGKTFLSEKQMSFGQRIIFDTFLKEGVIYEIK